MLSVFNLLKAHYSIKFSKCLCLPTYLSLEINSNLTYKLNLEDSLSSMKLEQESLYSPSKVIQSWQTLHKVGVEISEVSSLGSTTAHGSGLLSHRCQDSTAGEVNTSRLARLIQTAVPWAASSLEGPGESRPHTSSAQTLHRVLHELSFVPQQLQGTAQVGFLEIRLGHWNRENSEF